MVLLIHNVVEHILEVEVIKYNASCELYTILYIW